jgi:hypothetical protein
MKILEVVIYKNNIEQVFVLDSYIQEPDGVDKDGKNKFKKTEVKVKDIIAKEETIYILLSNDKSYIFNGFPYILVTEK